MSPDLTGGLDPAREYVFASQPQDPEMRESVNAWIWDEGVEVGLPRIAIEAVADQWDTHDIQFNLSYADGRIFLMHAPGTVHDPSGPDGQPRVLGAGPLSFELIEPFLRWRVRYSGLAVESTTEEQMLGKQPAREPTVPVEIDIELVSAAPPWENGALLPEAKRVLEEQDEGALMGGPRFEQLCRASGTLRVGDREHRIDGGALRIRRTGVRRMGTFRGHSWQSSVFPSGRGFGYIVYPPREDGLPTYNEGYLFEPGGELIPARVVEAPWLRTMQQSGEAVAVVLESERGTTRITGETLLSCFTDMTGLGPEAAAYPILQQAIVQYDWEGETANGMMERSLPGNQVQR